MQVNTEARADPVRVGCWPRPGDYDYLRLFYLALAPFNIQVEPEQVPLSAASLVAIADTYDAIHLNWPEWQWNAAGGFASGLRVIRRLSGFVTAAQRLGVPIIWTAHNLAGHDHNTLLDRIGFALLKRRADLVLCHDRSAFERVRAGRSAKRATLIVRHGSFLPIWPRPASRAETRRRLGAGPETRLLLCFGVIRPYKGFDVAAQALEHLTPQYHLVIAGRSADDDVTRELEARQSARLRVLAERFTNQELVDLLEACDCVLLPYRAITGSGVLVAALSAGRGVVATRLPFFEDMLAPEPMAGVLCDQGPAALANAIHEFFELPMHERSAAAARLIEHYDWNAPAVAAWLREHARPRAVD